MRRLSSALLAVTLVGGAVCAMPVADAAGQVWNGKYSLLRYAGEKTGTSLAARQPEPDFSDVYNFVTDCSSGTCVATVIDGPKPANPTLPLPPRYTWNGSTWVHIYEWQWDCYHGRRRSEGVEPGTVGRELHAASRRHPARQLAHRHLRRSVRGHGDHGCRRVPLRR